MTTFFIVRHGETEWNKERRLQGHLDSSLTEQGREQARCLAKALVPHTFDAIFCSSSGRAIETAKIIMNELAVPLQFDDRLREIYLGKWQGQLIADIVNSSEQSQYLAYCEHPERYVPVHTESFAQVTARAMAVLQEVIARFPNGRILIVTHGVTIQCIVRYIQSLPLAKLWSGPSIEGTSVTELEVIDDVWKLQRIGCTKHLT